MVKKTLMKSVRTVILIASVLATFRETDGSLILDGVFVKNTTGVITSPNFPDRYPEDTDRIWELVTTPGLKIKLEFYLFELESSNECDKDSVQIYDGSFRNGKLLGKFCGSEIPPPILSTSDRMDLIFHSDGSLTGNGFAATHKLEIPVFYVVITNTTGTVTSPNYPNRYFDNNDQIWEFAATPGFCIKLQFDYFNLESSEICVKDYVEIFDGPFENNIILRKICGNKEVRPIFSTNNRMAMRFHSDEVINNEGFVATYKSVPLRNFGSEYRFIRAAAGVITSPNHPNNYPPDIDFIWMLETEPGAKIKLVFEYFDIQLGVDCDNDYVAIYNGHSLFKPLIGKFCGNFEPPPIISLDNKITIEFHSDDYQQKTGFEATYMRVSESKQPCTADQFSCLNGECVGRSWFCDNADDCGDNSDEIYCDAESSSFEACPDATPPWEFCANRARCYPSVWKCDGRKDCVDGSDERDCQYGIRSISGKEAAERNLTQFYMSRTRYKTRFINKWSADVGRTAVALFLNDRKFFASNNSTGEEIAYELSLQLLSKLVLKKKILTNDLALYINALIVACINPKNFFGINLVDELRKRVNNNNYTDPFSVLTLCTAKDTITPNDILKLQQQYDAHFRPTWTETQAMVVMALSCISFRTDVGLEERILDEKVSELKKKQNKNGTIDSLKTTALVVQALLAAKNYQTDFDLNGAINFILQEVRQTYPSIQDIYYILPILNSKSLVNINSEHCETFVETDSEVLKTLRDSADERIQVQTSVVIGDGMDFTRTWAIRVPSNYSLYQVLENIGILEPDYKVQYSATNGKPYVVGLPKFQDDAINGFFWFIYTKPLSSDGNPKLIEESPVDIQVNAVDELILWYRSGFWAKS